jgi:predicted nucleic-acid-binding Zn-ribbon protein
MEKTMELSRQQDEAFQDWHAVIVNKIGGCPICGNSKFPEDMMANASIVRLDNVEKPKNEAQVVAVLCGQCGGTQFFCASRIGIQV